MILPELILSISLKDNNTNQLILFKEGPILSLKKSINLGLPPNGTKSVHEVSYDALLRHPRRLLLLVLAAEVEVRL